MSRNPKAGGDLQWLIYLGYGAIASIDSSITIMMCFVLYKNRLEIGINHISQHSNGLLLNLITYALATGLITTLFAILGLVLYIARPDTFLYISVMFSITRLYANSMLAMLNVRRRLKSGPMTDSLHLSNITNDVVFREVSLPISGMSTQTRQDSISLGVARSRQLPVIRTLQDASTIDPEKGGVEDEIWPSAKGSPWSAQSRCSLSYQGDHTD
ncbi:hypothetical protein D9756_008716 [Leucocoprinus leucothites]|uniref:DUF6534 domain-containing protein n=1 Tax=Leucocoprinus leucothites TaxID=201217 RepID=A0A8H5FUW3_9AGAR|nr:hypothetical protein D9756_008716 [Leucoagaricus leucothites]